MIALTDESGRLLWVSAARPERASEITACRHDNLTGRLRAAGLGAIADLGFVGLDDSGPDADPAVITGYKAARNRPLTRGQKLSNKVLAAVRAPVEHGFAHLKNWRLTGRKRLRRTGANRYECDIRVHLKPRLGHLRLDKLRVHHIDTMFDAINERNIEIQEQNAQRRAVQAELKTIPNKGAENRARRKWFRAQLDAMPPFRRITGLNTQPHIRDTLRAALNVAIA